MMQTTQERRLRSYVRVTIGRMMVFVAVCAVVTAILRYTMPRNQVTLSAFSSLHMVVAVSAVLISAVWIFIASVRVSSLLSIWLSAGLLVLVAVTFFAWAYQGKVPSVAHSRLASACISC